MPLDNTVVIPAGWSEHHRPVVAGTMTAVCDVTRSGGEGTFDRDTAETTPSARVNVALAQACRVQRLPARTPAEGTGGQEVTTEHFLVVLPWSGTEYQPDDLVTLTSCDEDPTLLTHPLTVITVERGSLLWERDLICIDNQG